MRCEGIVRRGRCLRRANEYPGGATDRNTSTTLHTHTPTYQHAEANQYASAYSYPAISPHAQRSGRFCFRSG